MPEEPDGATVIELSAVQRTIARRMQESSQAVPSFWASMDIDLTEVAASRRTGDWPEGKPSINDFIIKSVASTLREFPEFNATFEDGRIVRHAAIDIGVAVSSESALLVPVVRQADKLSLSGIGRVVGELAQRAREGTLAPGDMRGGTFTVSNLGMFGVTAFRAIVNAPQVAILAVGAARRVPIEASDAVAFRDALTLTLTCDHRAVYGADGARFLSRLRDYLESPENLLAG